MEALKFIGLLIIIFGIIDFAGMFFGYDLTGVSWSPVVAGVIGGFLISLGDEES